MELKEQVRGFWNDVVKQNADRMKAYFNEDALINWHNTNEQFTVDEYIRANCEYPGEWKGVVVRIEQVSNKVITVTKVWEVNSNYSTHAISFFEFNQDKINSLNEYWSEDGEAPLWRQEMGIGSKILK